MHFFLKKKEPDHFGWPSVFLLFFQVLGSFVLILFCDNYNCLPCITYMGIYHPCVVFLAGYGWFEGKNLYFNIQICVYHILFTDKTTGYIQGLIQAVFDIDIPILGTLIWVLSNPFLIKTGTIIKYNSSFIDQISIIIWTE